MLTGDPEGPFGAGTFYALPARSPYWSELDRYIWTYALQMNGWKGHAALTNLCRGMWTARASTNSPNLTALRAFLEANFDVDATLNYLALRQWSCGCQEQRHQSRTPTTNCRATSKATVLQLGPSSLSPLLARDHSQHFDRFAA